MLRIEIDACIKELSIGLQVRFIAFTAQFKIISKSTLLESKSEKLQHIQKKDCIKRPLIEIRVGVITSTLHYAIN